MAGPGKPGRPKGYPKTGGRQKGAIDKIKREAILAAQGITPLDYLMTLVRAETPPGLDPAVARARETLRFEAAKAAAPYVHARLQSTTLAGDPERPLKVDSMSELEAARRLAFLMTKAAVNAA
jgi:hypothetical protein